MLPDNRPGEITDQDLILALQQGKPEALSAVYDKYAPVLMGLLARMVQDTEMAEALLQKTFVTIWFKRGSYDATRLSFMTWVILMARDTAKANLITTPVKQFSKTVESSNFTFAENRNQITWATEPTQEQFCCRLDEQEKQALELVYLKGYSCEEAATQLGIPVEALKEKLKMAIKNLGAEKAA